jgi:RNA 3'-terminal phosphate cyclase
MADQIALYLALGGGVSAFTTSRITGHLRTNLHVIGKFTGVLCRTESTNRVSIEGNAL